MRPGRCSASPARRSVSSAGTGSGHAEVRFEIERLPLVEGRFQFNLTLTDAAHSRRYHSMEKAAEFAVLPQGESRGFFMLEGDWSLAESLSPRS